MRLFKKKSFVISRPERHHMIIFENRMDFSTEHPLSCNMKLCDIHNELSWEWDEAPEAPGRYLIMKADNEYYLMPEEPYREYRVFPL